MGILYSGGGGYFCLCKKKLIFNLSRTSELYSNVIHLF